MDWFSWLSRTSLDPSLIYDYGLTFARNELQLEDATHFNHEFLQSMGISIAKHRLEILKLVNKQQPSSLRHNNKLSGVIRKCLRKCISKLKNDVNAKTGTPVLVPPPPLPEVNWYHNHQGKWKGTLMRKQSEDPVTIKEEKPIPIPIYRSKTIALSGPLDGSRMHEKVLSNNNKALKLSGPLDGRMVYANRSPLMSRPVDGRFSATTKSPRVSGQLDPRLFVENRSPRVTRPLDPAMESPMGHSPYNKPKAGDFDFDDDHALWPTLFQDMKPT